MAISYDKEWAKQANAATERRDKLNTPWEDKQPKCDTCGVVGKMSMYNPNVCDTCIAAAFDVLGRIEK